MNYYDDFRGEPNCDSFTADSGETTTLPDQPCKFVQIHNWTTNIGTVSSGGAVVVAGGGVTPAAAYTPTNLAATVLPGDAEDGTELYYGFRGRLCGQIFAGSRSDMIPCTNLNQICVRPGTAGAREVFYTWWN